MSQLGSLPQIEANISEEYLLTQPPSFTMVSEADHQSQIVYPEFVDVIHPWVAPLLFLK